MRNIKVFLGAVLCGLGSIALAQTTNIESFKLPDTFLNTVTPRTAHADEARALTGASKHGVKSFATTGLPGVDTLTNWSDQFTAAGYDNNGNPQSVWPYTMVGTPPESGQTTSFNAPIVPVTVELLDASGNVAVYKGHRLIFNASQSIVTNIVNSPTYQPWLYTNGTGQFNDQMFRAEFWSRISEEGEGNGWHNILQPKVRTTRRMQIPSGYWYFAVDANNHPVAAIVDANTFSNLLFPPTYPVDNSTVIGAAELAGDITTHDISTFLFNNVYLYVNTIQNCCILGFHSYDYEPGDSQNGNLLRYYVVNYSSWISPGLFGGGFEDVTAHSHEMSETFNDPFVDNATPWWGSGGNCQNNLETGDVIEGLNSLVTYSTTGHNLTYHPQNEALFSWFASQSPSHARLGAYSFPDETTLRKLSPGNLLPNCVAAP